MANIIKEIKARTSGEIFSETELDNIMVEYDYLPIEDDEDENIIKYSNYRSQIWIDVTRDEENDILVEKVRKVTKEKGIETEVEPFHSFEDLKLVLDWFYDHKKYHHWLNAMLQTLLGRRVGDITALKWSEFYLKDGQFRSKLKTLREEKTGKTIGLKLPEYAKTVLNNYCTECNINPMEHYEERIFSTSASAFREALKNAVKEVGLTYNISCHSFRKFFGNQSYKLHPHDADRIKMIQFLFGHSSEEITKLYIATIDEKKEQYMDDFSEYMKSMFEGKNYEIDNSPVITIKNADLRLIVYEIYMRGKTATADTNDIEQINELITKIEQMRVQ